MALLVEINGLTLSPLCDGTENAWPKADKKNCTNWSFIVGLRRQNSYHFSETGNFRLLEKKFGHTLFSCLQCNGKGRDDRSAKNN